MRRRSAVMTAVAVAALLAGCAPSSPEAIEAMGITEERASDPVIPTGPGGEFSVVAFDLGFRDLEGIAVDGPNVVTIENVGDAEHNIRIDDAAGDNLKVSAMGGETNTGELQLFGRPGDGQEYVYYCDIPGHRPAGMEGTLVVYSTPEEAEEGPLGTTEPGAEPDA